MPTNSGRSITADAPAHPLAHSSPRASCRSRGRIEDDVLCTMVAVAEQRMRSLTISPLLLPCLTSVCKDTPRRKPYRNIDLSSPTSLIGLPPKTPPLPFRATSGRKVSPEMFAIMNIHVERYPEPSSGCSILGFRHRHRSRAGATGNYIYYRCPLAHYLITAHNYFLLCLAPTSCQEGIRCHIEDTHHLRFCKIHQPPV